MTDALALISKGEAALAEAASIHEIVQLRDEAAALQVFAVARGFGEAAQKAKLFQLKAERKAGVWLSSNGFGSHGGDRKSRSNMGLDDLGIERHESPRWQIEAQLPEPEFNTWSDRALETGQEISAAGLRRKVKEWQRERRAEEDQSAAQSIGAKSDSYELHAADFAELTLPSLVQAVITDPPYPKKYLGLYDDLSEFAARSLMEGGSLVAMVNHAHLPEVLGRLGQHLTYRWTLALLLKGPRARMFQRKINVGWKPVVCFTRGSYRGPTHTDVIPSGTRQKDRFEWQQNVDGFRQLVEIFSRPGQTICDPMCGVGTTGIAALTSGRRFIGIDIDETKIASCKVRFMEHGLA